MRWLEACGIDDADDRERWFDQYRLVVRDARAELTAGCRTIVEAASVGRRTNRSPIADVEIPGVTFGGRVMVGTENWTPPLPPVIGWDPDQGDAFRAAVDQARRDIEEHWRAKIERMRRKVERRLGRALPDVPESDR